MLGRSKCFNPDFKRRLGALQRSMFENLEAGILAPPNLAEDFVHHVPRELNTEADSLANAAMHAETSRHENLCFPGWVAPEGQVKLLLAFDGGRQESQSSCGYVIALDRSDSLQPPLRLAEGAIKLGNTSVVAAELSGLENAWRTVLHFAHTDMQLWPSIAIS